MDKSKLGIVYVLSNPAIPGIVKIGRSDQKDLKQRLRSLFNTSVPLPFKVEFACYVEKADTKNLEAALHSAFADKRVHEKREFFRVQKEQVIPILQFCNKGEATKHVSHQLSTLDENAESDNLLDILVQTQKFIDFTESKSPLAFKMSAIRKHAEIIPLPNLRYKFEEEDTFISMVAEDYVLNYGKKI